MTVVGNGCPLTTAGHESQIDSRHDGNDREQGGKIGKYQKVYVKVKNEYDVSSFGDFPLNRPEVRLYGHSKKVISRENRSKKTSEEKSILQKNIKNSTENVNKDPPEIESRLQAFSCQN